MIGVESMGTACYSHSGCWPCFSVSIIVASWNFELSYVN